MQGVAPHFAGPGGAPELDAQVPVVDPGPPGIHPEAAEGCDGVDTDCDGAPGGDETDDDCDGVMSLDEADADGDGDHACTDCDDGDPAVESFDLDGDFFSTCDGDCDDSHPAINPYASDYVGDGVDQNCDGIDNDCDPVTDEEGDVDADGFSLCDGDCDDGDAATSPAAYDVCDGLDNDCNGAADDLCVDCGIWVPFDEPSIASAVAGAIDGDVICVAPDTHPGSVDFSGKAIHLLGVGGPAVTILDGNGTSTVVRLESGEGPDSVLQGFTLTNGNAVEGGGVSIRTGSPTLDDLVIEDCSSTYGGGLFLESTAATITNTWITGNAGLYFGGGLYASGGSPQLDNVVIHGNNGYSGGGISVANSGTVTVTNSIVLGNEATTGSGGGVYMSYGTLEMENVVISGNTSGGYYGGGLSLSYYATVILTNSAVVSNYAFYGGGVYVYWGSTMVAANSTFTHNSAYYGGGFYGYYADISFVNCNTWNNSPENFYYMADPTGYDGNISEDPLYLDMSDPDPLYWDLHLGLGSALVDAGNGALADPDGGASDIGSFGGPGAAFFDLDLDGYPLWWQPGEYDGLLYPADGWDCDDFDPLVNAANGC